MWRRWKVGVFGREVSNPDALEVRMDRILNTVSMKMAHVTSTSTRMNF